MTSEQKKAYAHAYYVKNREKLLRDAAAWQARNPEKVRAIKRRSSEKYNRVHRYGVTDSHFHAMLQQQENKCAACGDTFAAGKSTHLDHCHKTGRVRGVLCRACNLALGFLQDSPTRISGLLTYLRTV